MTGSGDGSAGSDGGDPDDAALDRYRAILEEVTDLVTVLDDEGRASYVSPSVEPMLGHEPDDLVGEVVFEYVHPDDREAVRAAFAPVVEGEPSSGYFRFRAATADGGWRWLEPTVPSRASSSLEGHVISLRDVTAQVQDEQRLARFETIVETVPDGVYATDAEGRFTMMNEALADLLGGEIDELLGYRASDFVAEEDHEASMRLRRALEEGERDAVQVEFDAVSLDGEQLRVENRFTRLPGEPFAGTAGVVRDISERTRREADIRRQNERLDEFAGVVSHDLRNPLGVARGRLDLALETGELEHVERARGAIDRMEGLLDRLLDLARAGRDVDDVETVALEAVVEEAWAMAGDGAARLETDALGTLACDRERTRQLFENLFANAVTHAGPEVTVRAGRLPDGVYVEDDGPGIPADRRERVLEAGYSTVEAGTGLGLNIVRTIAQAHGWDVDVVAGTDGGARFEFTGFEAAGRGPGHPGSGPS